MSKKEILLTEIKETFTMQAVSSHSNLASFAGSKKTGNARGAGAKYNGTQVRTQANDAKQGAPKSNQVKFGYIPVLTECCVCCCAPFVAAGVFVGGKKSFQGIRNLIDSIKSKFSRGDKAEKAEEASAK